MRPGRWEHAVEFLDRLLPQLRQPQTDVRHVIGREHGRSAGVGDDRDPIAAASVSRRERAGGGEHLADRLDAHDTGPVEGRGERFVAADEGARVRHGCRGAFGVASRLDDDDRFGSRGGAQAAHEGARVVQPFDVEDDALRLRIGCEVVEDVAEVDVGGDPGRHDGGESDVAVLRPVEERGAQGARLRDERHPALRRVVVPERGVQPDARADQPEAVRSEKTDAVRPGEVQSLVLERSAGGPDLAEPG